MSASDKKDEAAASVAVAEDTSDYVGRRIARSFFDYKEIFFGTVTEARPPDFWLVVYDDEDSQEMDKEDLRRAFRLYGRKKYRDPKLHPELEAESMATDEKPVDSEPAAAAPEPTKPEEKGSEAAPASEAPKADAAAAEKPVEAPKENGAEPAKPADGAETPKDDAGAPKPAADAAPSEPAKEAEKKESAPKPASPSPSKKRAAKKAKCDICGYGDGHHGLILLQCRICDLRVHRDCYGLQTWRRKEFVCWACDSVGRCIPASEALEPPKESKVKDVEPAVPSVVVEKAAPAAQEEKKETAPSEKEGTAEKKDDATSSAPKEPAESKGEEKKEAEKKDEAMPDAVAEAAVPSKPEEPAKKDDTAAADTKMADAEKSAEPPAPAAPAEPMKEAAKPEVEGKDAEMTDAAKDKDQPAAAAPSDTAKEPEKKGAAGDKDTEMTAAEKDKEPPVAAKEDGAGDKVKETSTAAPEAAPKDDSKKSEEKPIEKIAEKHEYFKLHEITQTKRPTDCILCNYNPPNAKTAHAMHPVYDNLGPSGRQKVIRDKNGELKLAWAHTLCAFLLSEQNVLYGVQANGTTHEGQMEDETDERAANPFLVEEDEKVIEDCDYGEAAPMHHFVYFTILGEKVMRGNKAAIRLVQEFQANKCNICNQSTINGLEIPIQCSAGHKNEYREFRPTHTETLKGHECCTAAMHVGCARWGITLPRRVFFFPGSEAMDPVHGTYCNLHAVDVTKKHKEWLERKETAESLKKRKARKKAMGKYGGDLTLTGEEKSPPKKKYKKLKVKSKRKSK